MPNFADQNIIPSEGLFRTGATNDPGNTLYLLKGGKVYVLAPEGRAGTDDKLDAALSSLGVSRQQYDQIPVYNQSIVATGALKNQVQGNIVAPSAQDLQSAITTAKPFAQQISTPQADPTAFTGQIPGGLATSVGSKVTQAPQIAATAQSAADLSPQFAGAVQRNLASEQEFVKNWKGKGGRLPTPEEVNQGVYGVPNPTFTTSQGTLKKGEGVIMAAGAPSGEVTTTAITGEKKFTDISELPEEIQNNPLFRKLDANQQEVLAGSWKAMQADSVLTQIRWNEAMKEATKLADPIFKSQIRLAQDQLERSITSLIANNESARKEIDTNIANLREDLKTRGERFTAEQFEQKLRDMEGLSVLKDRAERESGSREAQVGADVNRIKNRIADIEEDLVNRKEDITIDEEKALARQLRQYKDELKQAQQSAVNAGLGFSSIREEAEQRLKEELQDVSESTRRQAARQIRDIELETGRGKRDLGLQREDIERKNQEARVDLARTLEQRIGFENIPENIKSVLGDSFATLKTQQGQQVRSELDIREEERQRKAKQEQEDIERTRQRAEREREIGLQELERSRKEKLTQTVREGEELLGTTKLPTLATQEVNPLGEPIQGTLEQQQTERIGSIRQSLLESQPLFTSQL